MPDATIDVIAAHEAGHAVMRWLRGLPATELTVTADGGLCAGTGRVAPAEGLLLVKLAGFAVESGYGVFARLTLDTLAESHGSDFDEARRMLADCEWLRILATPEGAIVQSVDEALVRHFHRAGELLWPHSDLVDALADRLEYEGRVSARSVAALCREHEKRERARLKES